MDAWVALHLLTTVKNAATNRGVSLILYTYAITDSLVTQQMFTKCNVPSSKDQMEVSMRRALPPGSLERASI